MLIGSAFCWILSVLAPVLPQSDGPRIAGVGYFIGYAFFSVFFVKQIVCQIVGPPFMVLESAEFLYCAKFWINS
jgi:hypothetical protein